MVDPNTLVGAGLAAIASKDILVKVLGPTADYLGGEIKGIVEKCNINIGDIFIKAYRKLGNKAEEPGAVNPRVLKNVFDDGKYCEDDLTKEYFAGVLASSKTENGTDDRGVTNAKLISNLSSYQIRTHYIFYALLRKAFLPYNSVIFPGTDRYMMFIYIPTEIYFEIMGIKKDFPNHNDRINILSHSMNGLRRNDLIEDNFTYGGPEFFKQEKIKYRFGPDFAIRENILSDHGITFQPTPGGMELYLWAHGMGQITHFQFLDSNLELETIQEINLPDTIDLLYKDLIESRKNTTKES